jgi:amino acid adenylation domain-containing protein
MSAAAPALLPIGSLQRSMVLASLRAPRDGFYLVQDVCELVGQFDIPLLRRAWREVVDRHPAIRSAVFLREQDPAGFLLDAGIAGHWQDEDLRRQSLENFFREDRERGFDFESGAPVRITAVRTSDQNITLIWTIHHALLDGRSLTLVWQEWLACYEALLNGRDLPPVEPEATGVPHQQDDAAAQQFWRDYLHGLSQTTDYIVDRIPPVPAAENESDGRTRAVLSEDLTRMLRDLAAHHGVTLNNIVQGAWALLLSRYSGRLDVVFGVARAGRGSSLGNAQAVGFYLNALPLRIAIDPHAAVGLWLKAIRSQWLTLRGVEHTPSQQIVKWSSLPAGMPPFESVLNYEHEPPGETLSKLGGLWAGVRFRRLQRTDSRLTLAASGSPTLTLELIFDRGRFSQRAMDAAAGHLRELLASFAAQPDARLRDLNMLTAEERTLLLNGHERMPLPDLCAHELFEQQAERTPSQTAIDTSAGVISYGKLNEKANRLACRLREAGVSRGDVVAVYMEPTPESVVAILAALKAGAAFLPIDPAFPEQRVETILADASPKLVLSGSHVDAWSTEGAPCANHPNVVTPDDLAYIIYTSGSSGPPKAVEMPHRGLVNHSLAAALAYGISTTDRRLQFASIGADVFIAEVFNYLCCGAALVYGWDRRNKSIREFLRYVDDRRITIVGIPSGFWSEWMAGAKQSGSAAPASLRAVIIGMEKADPGAFKVWRKLAGSVPRLFNAYGPTETSPTATVYEAGSSPWEANSYVPIGRPLANTNVCVLDEHGSPVPIGVPGELYIGGRGVARGYRNRPELTTQRFVADSFSEGASNRMYRTGDIVFYLPDGNLVFVGRVDRQVKIRGFRVELDEIETVLAGHADVQQCAVVFAAQGGGHVLAAFLASRRPANLSPDALRSYLLKRVPEHMIPAVFAVLPSLPVTSNGKIDRQSLPLGELERVRPQSGFQPLSTELEQRLAEIWRQILNVWPIGASDNFFELGADSLHATRLLTLVEANFGLELDPSLLWRVPTLGRMAAVLENRESPFDLHWEHEGVVPLQPDGSRIPFFCFPGADDDPETFVRLALHLGSEQPFFVVRDPRPLSERGAYTVEQAAERLVEAILQVRKTGPYVVGGHCYGGLVAFEAARRLAAMGEVVSKIVMFEVATPGYPKVLRNWKNYLRVTPLILRGQRRVKLSEIRAHFQVLWKLARKRAATHTRRALDRTPLTVVGQSPGSHREMHPNKHAARIYVPTPLSCSVVQIIAAGEHHSTVILDDPRLGWRHLVRGIFTVTETPGPADAIFKLPHVRGLALVVESLLDGLNSQRTLTTRR